MKILVINGPNINMLGIREPDVYGNKTYKDLCEMIKSHADSNGYEVELYQSNHEGDIVDKIQSAHKRFEAIIINPAAYTHTSVAILDALKSVGIPTAEVHISDVSKREAFRQISYVREYCDITICGRGFDGYIDAIEYFLRKDSSNV